VSIHEKIKGQTSHATDPVSIKVYLLEANLFEF
jgi:hypothetical protein